MALVLLVGGPLAVWLSASLPLLLLVFRGAVRCFFFFSVGGWRCGRGGSGSTAGRSGAFDHDINDD